MFAAYTCAYLKRAGNGGGLEPRLAGQRGLGPVPYLSRATRTTFTFGRSFHLDVVSN